VNTSNGSDWKAIGVAMLVIVVLGLFDKTRTIAIFVAVVLGGLMILHKTRTGN
jgi:hypothetical protein